MMGLSIVFLILIIVVATIVFHILVETVQERGIGPVPKKLTLLSCTLLGLHVVFFMANGYSYIPERFVEILFPAFSLSAGISGNISALREVNHNRFVAVLLSCFSTFSILFCYLLYGISQM